MRASVGLDAYFRDGNGNIIGRAIDGRDVVIDPDTLPALLVARPAGAAASDNAGAQARSEAKNEPKLCPEPTPENITGRSERTLLYQTQITGLPPGLQVVFNGERYDGCRESDGTLLEAKGEGYADMMFGRHYLPLWYQGTRELLDQLPRHAKFANGRIVEYHFAEKEVADWFRIQAAKHENVIVFYTPLVRCRDLPRFNALGCTQ